METFLIKAVQLMLSLTILVLIHELGHFSFSRLFKVRVDKFYIFFDPWFSLFKYKSKKSGTEYGIGWLPFGGYTKIAGMIDESMDTEQMAQPEQPWEFRSKPAGQRLLIMIAGVINNFILALIIYAMIAFVWGDTILPIKNIGDGFVYGEIAQSAGFQNGDIPLSADGKTLYNFSGETIRALAEAHEVEVLRDNEVVKLTLPDNLMLQLLGKNQRFIGYRIPVVVQETISGYGAVTAGLQKGDSIVAVNGVATPDYTDFTAAIGAYKGSSVDIAFVRDGQEMTLPVEVNAEGQIGIMLVPSSIFYPTETIYYGFFESIPKGIKKGFSTLVGYVSDLKYIFTKEGANNLGGFGTIGSIFPSTWNWQAFWEMTAFLSIILAFMNILPIPALDGGHVLFLLYEVITRRKPNEKFLEYAQVTGMVLLFALLIYANLNDVIRFFF
ncbi:MAG: RIP metalloprotease RseP [Porphyromonadaceae bacterium]|nr:RIP metalloprotease RseP [Porphyromonadaceae bacterium]